MNLDDPRASRSRQALLSASMELLLRNPDASFSDIAIHAGVGRATLYRHFQTRELLIQELTKQSLEKISEAKKPIRDNSLKGREAIETMLKLIMPHADHLHFLFSLWSIAEKDQNIMQIYKDQLKELSKWINQAKRQSQIKKEFSTDWIVATIETIIYSSWLLIASGKISTKAATDHAVSALFEGIAA